MAGKINLTDELKKYFGFNKFKGKQKQSFPVALLFDIKQFAALPYSLFPAVVLHNPTLPYTLSCFLKGFQT